MKKLIKFIVLVLLVILGITADFQTEIKPKTDVDTRTVEEKIMETVVIVNSSSGIVIRSLDETAIILTAYHVISDDCELDICDYGEILVSVIDMDGAIKKGTLSEEFVKLWLLMFK